jgi:mRNA interferase MazF
MPSYSKNEVILIRYPFSNLSGSKIRPAIVVGEPHPSQDLFVVPLTSRNAGLLSGEFPLANWAAAGLNVPSAVKRGLFTIHQSLVLKTVGSLREPDAQSMQTSLREWLGL